MLWASKRIYRKRCAWLALLFRECNGHGPPALNTLLTRRSLSVAALTRSVPARCSALRRMAAGLAGQCARRPVSRVLSRPSGLGRPFIWDAHRCAPRATNPGGGTGMSLRHRRGFLSHAGRWPPLFGLAPGGVCRAALVTERAVRSYRTISPLPAHGFPCRGRYVFCGTFPGVAPAGGWPAPYSRGARTFLRRGWKIGGGHPVVWRGVDVRISAGSQRLMPLSRLALVGSAAPQRQARSVKFASPPVLFRIAARLQAG